MFLGADDLAGLPEFLKSAMAGAAEARGRKGEYAVTLSRSIYEPFTTFSERRDLREKAFKAFIGRGETGGATDNAAVVTKMLALRTEKASSGFAAATRTALWTCSTDLARRMTAGSPDRKKVAVELR